MSNEERLKILVKECIDELEKINIKVPKGYTYLVSKKLTSTLGICFRKKKTIKIANYLFGFEDKYVKETIIHEMLHAATSKRCCHGNEWRMLAHKVNVAYPQYNVTRTADLYNMGKTREEVHKILGYKYIERCDTCGTEWGVFKMTESQRKGLLNGTFICLKCNGRKFSIIDLQNENKQ